MRVAILGTGSGWHHVIGETDQYDEIWGLNSAYRIYDRLRSPLEITRWFELHGDNSMTRARRPLDHWNRLAQMTIPIYTLYELPGVQTAVAFPLAEVVAIRDYFSCTFCYQIGLAIALGATSITLYGAPLIGTREALVERPCVEWWLGYAHGIGIQTRVVHDEPYGLGRQAFRYAMDDPEERYMAYRFVIEHAAEIPSFLTDEDRRLRYLFSWRERLMRWCLPITRWKFHPHESGR